MRPLDTHAAIRDLEAAGIERKRVRGNATTTAGTWTSADNVSNLLSRRWSPGTETLDMRIDPDPATMPDSWSRPCPVRRARAAPELPGCRPISLLRCDLDDYDGRFEYWDGDTETAWVSEPTGDTHEIPSHRLAGSSQVIAGVRGSPIECLGTMDLLLRKLRNRVVLMSFHSLGWARALPSAGGGTR